MTVEDWTPGDLGRLALWSDPVVVADQLRGWASPEERARVVDWFDNVAYLLREPAP
jgi:hypothetical protein